MSLALRIIPEAVRSLAFGGIGAAYANVGTALANPSRILLVQNLTDATLMFSLDGGVSDAFPLLANASFLLDVTANRTMDRGAFIAQGTQIMVKRVGVAGAGSVYVSSFYGTSI